ncbi:MFS transporter [Enterococcus canintestini]|uniref:Phosphoglycerate transporter n=1 Tax=Enterococcus canintestini TaxID=317010 RepID=A0A267HS16_9ENTE|nr:MFS transporter [Enterococcus canintestini]PAB00283.1 phosphoglycerate transporter [Enterococcus canintestini]
MFHFLKPRQKDTVPTQDVERVFKKFKWLSFIGVFIGYATFYIVRNNFSLSTPKLEHSLNISKTEIGFLCSCLLISYGLSKGIMSSLSDKADPKRFMALGLFLCSVISILLFLFGHSYLIIAFLIILLGIFQGMGVGPAFITISNWFEKRNRGFITAIWNSSHNIGGGVVSPLIGFMLAIVGQKNWRFAYYVFPGLIALVVSFLLLFLVKGKPENEGLPPLKEHQISFDDNVSYETLSSKDILVKYVLKNKGAWYVAFIDTFVYMIRFGIITWLPIFLLEVKGFSNAQMMFAFLVFEWAAIPSTIFAGIISDKFFKGYRMPPAIIALSLIIFCLIGYWNSTSVFSITLFAAAAGCLIYIPQFLTSVQTMEVVPSFAVGSAVGLRGFMSYIFGSTLGTCLLGAAVDHWGWNAGLFLLLGAAVICVIFCLLSHLNIKSMGGKLDD